MHKLYKLNFPNGKCYVGITGRSVEKRFKEHAHSKYPTGLAIRRFGTSNITIQILDEGTSEYIKSEEARIVNAEWVKSSDNYNLCEGGDQHRAAYKVIGTHYEEYSKKCPECGRPCKGEICWECRLAKNKTTHSHCKVCDKRMTRPEYTICHPCRIKTADKCIICNKPLLKGVKVVHKKCINQHKKLSRELGLA